MASPNNGHWHIDHSVKWRYTMWMTLVNSSLVHVAFPNFLYALQIFEHVRKAMNMEMSNKIQYDHMLTTFGINICPSYKMYRKHLHSTSPDLIGLLLTVKLAQLIHCMNSYNVLLYLSLANSLGHRLRAFSLAVRCTLVANWAKLKRCWDRSPHPPGCDKSNCHTNPEILKKP